MTIVKIPAGISSVKHVVNHCGHLSLLGTLASYDPKRSLVQLQSIFHIFFVIHIVSDIDLKEEAEILRHNGFKRYRIIDEKGVLGEWYE